MTYALAANQCITCGIPVDAEFFDVSGCVGQAPGDDSGAVLDVATDPLPLPPLGEQKVLASFQLHAQYCGAIIHFWQYTDRYARDNAQIQTPGFEWQIFQNGKPIFPYTQLEMIINPWGYPCCPVFIRLDENARVEFILRNRSVPDDSLYGYPIKAFAGRIQGRYWYNDTFGKRIR